MASLAECLRLHGSNFSADEIAAIREAAGDKSLGYATQKKNAALFVDDTLNDLESERDDILSQAEKAGWVRPVVDGETEKPVEVSKSEKETAQKAPQPAIPAKPTPEVKAEEKGETETAQKPGWVNIGKNKNAHPFTEWKEHTRKGAKQGKVSVKVGGKWKLVEKSAVRSWPGETEKAEVKEAPKPKSEIIATDKVGDTEFEFRVGPVNDPSMPQMTHRVQMRRKGSDNEWESAMTGAGVSKKAALRKFAENYERLGDIKALNILDDELKGYADETVAEKEKIEQEKKAERDKQEAKAREEYSKVVQMQRNEIPIAETMKKAKAKKGEIELKFGSGRKPEKVDGYTIGEYAYHKSGEHYSATHIPSGMAIAHDLSQKEARELTYRLSKLEDKWDGKGKPPKDFVEKVGGIVKQFRGREVFYTTTSPESLADRYNLRYDGQWDIPDAPYQFTDNVTKSSILVKKLEDLPARIDELKRQYGQYAVRRPPKGKYPKDVNESDVSRFLKDFGIEFKSYNRRTGMISAVSSDGQNMLIDIAIIPGYDNTLKEKADGIHRDKGYSLRSEAGSLPESAFEEVVRGGGHSQEGTRLLSRKELTGDQRKIRRLTKQVFGIDLQIFTTTNPQFDLIQGITHPTTDFIFVNADSFHPLLVVAGHETFHQMKNQRPDLYQFVMESLSDKAFNLEKFVKDHNLGRVAAGISEMDLPLQMEEYLADFTGAQFADPKFWEKLNEKSPSMTVKLLRMVRGILSKIKRYFVGKESNKYFEDVEAARNVVAEALSRFSKERRLRAKGEGATIPRMSTKKGTGDITTQETAEEGGFFVPEYSAKLNTETEAFKRWFGKSVVTEDGEPGGVPRKVYHGTYGDFKEFKWGEDIGIHFGTIKQATHRAPSGSIIPAYLRAEKLLRLPDIGNWDEENIIDAIESENTLNEKESAELYKILESKDIVDALMTIGYDGIVYENAYEGIGGDSYIVFNPTQIKSIYNRGTWNPNDARISYATMSPEEWADNMADKLEGAESKRLKREANTVKAKIKKEQKDYDGIVDKKSKGDLPEFITEKFGKTQKTVRQKVSDAWDSAKEKEWWDRLAQLAIDRLHPIKAKLDETSYRLHRISTGSQATLAMFLRHGKLSWDQSGVMKVNTKEQGFMPFLKSLGDDWHKFLYWVAAHRAERLEGEKRERWLDQETRESIFEWAGGRDNPKWEKAAKQLSEFNANILDIAQEAGIINGSSRRKWEQDFYVPFYRVFEDEQERHDFLTRPDKISSQIKRLVGGKEKLGDPLENLLKNWSHLVHESMRNKARGSAFNFALSSGSLLVEPVDKKDLNIYKNSKDKKMVYITNNQDNVLMYLNKGRPVYFKVNDPALFQAMSDLNAPSLDNFIVKLMGKTKRALTFGATFGPGFRIANLLRDTMHTALINKSFKPFIDSARGVAKAWQEDEDYIAFMASGAGFGSSYIRADNPQEMSDYIKRIIKKEGDGVKSRILDTPKKMLDFWEKVGAASENAARVQLYRNLKEQGESHFEAAFQARDLLDFTMRGEANVVQFLIQTIPFVNARMQGLYKLGRVVADNNTRRNFVLRGSLMMAASLALWFLHKDDDEYKELEDWDRWSYYHFWLGGLHFRIPKPFEVGALFSTLPEAMADVLNGNEGTQHIANAIGYTAKETFSLSMPQLITPLMEQWANKSSYTGRPIIGEALKGLKPGVQAEPWTSETMQLAGKLGISPKRAEALIQGYFSTFGMFLLGMSDIAVRNIFDFPQSPSMTIDDYPAIGRFVKRRWPSRYTKQQTWFYDTFNDIDQTVRTINYYKATGDIEKARALSEKTRGTIKYRKMFTKTRKRISDINTEIKTVMRSDLSASDKRTRIDTLMQRKNAIVKMVREAVE